MKLLNHNIYRFISLSLLIILIQMVSSPPSYAESMQTHQILILDSNDGDGWSYNIHRGIRDVLAKGKGNSLYIEHMGINFNYDSEEDFFEKLYELYTYKYENQKFDLIIVNDDPAFQFMLKYGEKLFSSTPVVFCGVNNFEEGMLKGHHNFTGVVEEADIQGTIATALKLQPNTKQVVFFLDNSPFGDFVRQTVLEQLIPAYDSIRFVVFQDLIRSEIEEKIQQLADHTIIFSATPSKNKSSQIVNGESVIPMIANDYNLPVYNTTEFDVGAGIVGGHMISAYNQGKVAGEIAHRILQGEDIKNIPVMRKSVNQYMFDYKQLQRFKIKLSDLPENSLVMNQPQSFYFKYKKLVWGAGFCLFALASIIFILSINIIRRKRAEEELLQANECLEYKVQDRTAALKKEKDTLQKYLDVSEVVFLVLNKEGKVERINRKGCEIFGYQQEEMVGKDWAVHFIQKGECAEMARKALKDILNGKEVPYTESIAITRSGEERSFLANNTVLKDEEGNIEGILSSALDITKQKLLNEELEYSKLKEEFFSNLSHEFKTPLNLSFSALQMLELYHSNDLSAEMNKQLGKYTDIIKQNNYRLLKLANNLIDITQIHSSSFKLHLLNHDIVESIKKITDSVSDYIQNKNRIVEFYSNVEHKIMACDPFNIERILLNLLSNAIKFTEEGDKISVTIIDRGEHVLISVADTGIGVPQDKQKMIFERFRQVDKSLTRNTEGSGIGLAIVKLLVELHSGKITVASEYGKGSEFIIELPVKTIEQGDPILNNYNYSTNDFIDRIAVEFSDIYEL